MISVDSEIQSKKYEHKIAWNWVFYIGFIVSGGILGVYFLIFGDVFRQTYIMTFIFFIMGLIGISPGAHRLFCHRSYKVTRGMKFFMLFCQQLSGMKSVFTWCRIHRVHHKFSDTDKDPTNINRGLTFSFIGWMLLVPTPECKAEIKKIYMDDLLQDSDLVFQHRFYYLLFAIITVGLPTIIPYYIWNEAILVAFGMNLLRCSLNGLQQFLGNSLLHWNGTRPYDASTSAIDNVFYNILTLGEGFHNFHHAFPFDYRCNELTQLWNLASISTIFIDTCAFLGLVYDRKTASSTMISRRVARLGDGSHEMSAKDNFSDKNSWRLGNAVKEIADKME